MKVRTGSITLGHKQNIDLYPTTPFNFDASLHKPDHFPSADNHWVPGTRWQTMVWRGKQLGLKFENKGSVEEPCVRLSIFSALKLEKHFLDSLIEEINYRYSFTLDLSAFNREFANDPDLGPVIERWYGMRPLNCNSLYEYLIIAVVLQNATVRRSVNMLQALFENYGSLLVYDSKALFCFWLPEKLSGVLETDLRDLKIGYRAKSILRVNQAFVGRQVDEFDLRNKTKGEQRDALLCLYGVGPASVQYILSDVFHHTGKIEHISPWEARIYSKLFFDRHVNDPAAVDQLRAYFNARFPGFQALAVHYFWEDLFWKRKNEPVDWLEDLIRL